MIYRKIQLYLKEKIRQIKVQQRVMNFKKKMLKIREQKDENKLLI